MKKRIARTSANTVSGSDNPAKIVTRTAQQIERRARSQEAKESLARVAAIPDNEIDVSDIPDLSGETGWVRVNENPEHPLHKALHRLPLRIPESDVLLGQKLAKSKGLPYQTYMKLLLHEALVRESTRSPE